MSIVTQVPSPPERPKTSHKGDYGHLLILAGSRHMVGAAILSSRAALRSGVGLVTLGIPYPLQALVAPVIPGAMTLPLPATPEITFSDDAIQPALNMVPRISAIALGPGISTHDLTVTFATRIAQRANIPLVLDADGINCLAKTNRTLKGCTSPRILTPHPGEAGRLLNRATGLIQADRASSALELARKFGAVVVLKGHETLVSDQERTFMNRTGNPGMATGGSGDVLTGIIGALLAAGMEAFSAAVLGVHVHGLAGDLAAEAGSMTSLIAEDLIEHLGPAFRTLER